MKTTKKTALFAAICAAALLISCGGSKGGTNRVADRPANEKIDVLNQKEKLPLKVAVLTGYTQSDSRTEKWLEERYNLDINLIVLPGWGDAPSKISLLMSNEKERPDVIWWWGMDADFAKWKQAGLLLDVSTYMNKYTVMRDYYNSQDPSILFFASSEEGSMFRIPGAVAEPSCETLWIRKDWLDNLGLKVPTTLAELDDVLYQFTFNDPDKNGKSDTYGLGGDGHDFRTFWSWIQGSGTGRGFFSGHVKQADGTYELGPATPDAKIWLGRVAKLYKDGVITPNIINDTDRDEEMARGGFGVTYSWIAYNNPNHATMRSFYASNPGAEWIPIEMVTGDNGNPQDDPATIAAWCYFGITKNCKDPERLYAIWDDMSKPENYITRRFGLEGQEYTRNSDGSYEILIGSGDQRNQSQNIGLNLFETLFYRVDFCNIENIPSTTALFERAKNMSRDAYSILVERKDPNAYVIGNDIGTEIGDIQIAYYWSVIAGTDSIDNWDTYIANLKNAGLDKITAELTEIYGKQLNEQRVYLAGK